MLPFPLKRYYVKAVNCCSALREAAAAACSGAAPACPANTATMRCADLLTAIAAPASSYPPALLDWTCAAFPNDNLPGDSLIVALIALAVAVPVSIFLSGCFEIANDSEAPESWLRYAGVARILFGRLAHRRWHYTGPLGQPKRFVRWYIRSVDAPRLETLTNTLHAIHAAVTGAPPPWHAPQHAAEAEDAGSDDGDARHGRVSLQKSISMSLAQLLEEHRNLAAAQTEAAHIEDARSGSLSLQTSIRLSLMQLVDEQSTPQVAQAAKAEAAREEAARAARMSQLSSISWQMYSRGKLADDLDVSSSGASGMHHDEPSPAEEAAELRRAKRRLAALGLVGVAAVWAIMAWFIFTYGLLILQLMGLDAQRAFTRSWGISYGVGAAAEWRSVAQQAVLSVVLLAVAERLHLTRPVAWLEDHIEYMSTSALLLEHGGLSFFQELRLFFTFRRRLAA